MVPRIQMQGELLSDTLAHWIEDLLCCHEVAPPFKLRGLAK